MITERVAGQFYSYVGNNTVLTSYILQRLESFDWIINDDTLKDLEAVIDRKNHVLTTKPN